jgi:hypothetical protein
MGELFCEELQHCMSYRLSIEAGLFSDLFDW